MSNLGTLYLIPSPLGNSRAAVLPEYELGIVRQLQGFITERGKTARQFLKQVIPDIAFGNMVFFELNKHTEAQDLAEMLQTLQKGQSLGLISEAGCPGVADPGAQIVALAHQNGIKVVPLIGPSAILMSLMASGMNGQGFSFHGYLPVKPAERAKALRELEQKVQREGHSQLFIETPYRNQAMLETLLSSLQGNTALCVAANITMPDELIYTARVSDWKKRSLPDLQDKPTVFILGQFQ